jgi:pimeloyl-ACP methyl ester carboxylesterase
MLLLEQREPTQSQETPVLIVAPYAVHDASIGDFADSHSVAQILSKEHPVAMTFWKSATAQMRYYGIDAYLSDLNVAIDDLGGCASLVGLCQGGWLAAVYASRFPKKARKLVLVGAPIDLAATESRITRALSAFTPAVIEQFIEINGGIVSARMSLAMWVDGLAEEYNAATALQADGDADLMRKFDAWKTRAVDLPGSFSGRRRSGFSVRIVWRRIASRRSGDLPDCRASARRLSFSRLRTTRWSLWLRPRR